MTIAPRLSPVRAPTTPSDSTTRPPIIRGCRGSAYRHDLSGRLWLGGNLVTPLTKKLGEWLGLLLIGAVVVRLAAAILGPAVPFLAVALMWVVIAGVLLCRFRSSK